MAIEQLTPEQEAKLLEYKKQWEKIAFCTERADHEKAEYWITKIYEENGENPPTKGFMWFDSPFAIVDWIKNNTKLDLFEVMQAWVFGNHEVNWLGLYDFFYHECGVEECKKAENFIQAAKYTSWWIPTDEICFCSERPIIFSCDIANQFHNDIGPAIKYSDGYELYYLHGVSMEKEIVMTPAEQLNPLIVTKETNAERRREIVRKIGVERIFQKLGGKVIEEGLDESGVRCWLITLDIGDGRERPFIKLQNHSIPGIFHLEGVPPTCKTLKEAFEFRKPLAMKNGREFAEDGEDWYQQGDRYIYPKNAKKLKLKPKKLS